eukprot:6539313-Lingulodinium_polyedra.AAC.1
MKATRKVAPGEEAREVLGLLARLRQLLGQAARGAAAESEWQADMGRLAAEARAAGARLHAEAGKASREQWRAWVDESLDGSAKAAYGFLRAAEAPQWEPTVAVFAPGGVVSDPLGLLRSQGELWRGLW